MLEMFQKGGRTEWIRRSLAGEERLWKVFWIYGMLFTLVLIIALSLLLMFLDLFSVFTHYLSHQPRPPSLASGLFSDATHIPIYTMPYTLGACAAVWRCAFNTDHKIWGYSARIIAVLYVVLSFAVVYQFLFATGSMGDADTNFTLCTRQMTQYAEKYHVDPQTYISQNSEYLKKCVLYYAGHPASR